jgi:mannosyltransferase
LLDYQSLWNDELHSMNGANPSSTISEVIEYSKNDQPPFYFLILHCWFKVFAYNEYSARFLSALIGVLGVIVMYYLGREFNNKVTGLMCSFLTATNYFHISYSQEVRFYTLLFLLAALSYLFFLRAAKNSTVFNFLFYSIFTTLLLYTHYFGIVIMASQFCVFILLVLFYRRTGTFIIKAIGSGFAILFFISPWIGVFINDSAIDYFWIPPVSLSFLPHFLYEYFKDKLSFYLCGLLILYILFKLFINLINTKKMSLEVMVLLSWLVLGYGIPYIYSVMVLPMLISRYTMIVLPAVLMLIAFAIDTLPRRNAAILICLTIGISSIWSLVFVQDYYSSIKKEQFREAAMKAAEENTASTVIFSDHAWHFNYYLKLSNPNIHAVHPWELDYVSLLEKYDKVIVLINGKAFWEPLQKQLTISHFSRSRKHLYYNTSVEIYQKFSH